jgi:hypothetical protein
MRPCILHDHTSIKSRLQIRRGAVAAPIQAKDKVGRRFPLGAFGFNPNAHANVVQDARKECMLCGINNTVKAHKPLPGGRKPDRRFQASVCHARCGRQAIVHFLHSAATIVF